MAGPTDAELEKLRKDNEKKREQIESAKQKQADNEASANNEIEYAQLIAESARLDAQLASAQEAAKVTTVREGSQGLLTSVKEQLDIAVTQAATPPGPVDPNVDPTKKDGGNS